MRTADNTFSVDKPEDSSGFLLWQVTNLWQREIKKALQPFALTHSQFVILASAHWLNIKEQDVTQKVLSDHTKIDPMTTSAVVRTLQKKGLVDRKEHKIDTRAKTVKLTEKGKSIVKKAVVAVENFDADFFSRLGIRAKLFNEQLQVLLLK
jgi:DNA-binding MarR family transcriptional regulator